MSVPPAGVSRTSARSFATIKHKDRACLTSPLSNPIAAIDASPAVAINFNTPVITGVKSELAVSRVAKCEAKVHAEARVITNERSSPQRWH